MWYSLGLPHKLLVPAENISIENGEKVELEIEVHDMAGNLVTQPKLSVQCKVCWQKYAKSISKRISIWLFIYFVVRWFNLLTFML